MRRVALRNKPTFDPYSIGEFSVRDAIRSALQSWQKHKLAFLGLALLATLPTIIILALPLAHWSYLACGFAITFLIAIISPMVARLARGLSADLRGGLSMVRESVGQVVIVGVLLTLVIIGPALILLPHGIWVTYAGLTLGTLVAAPFVLTIPIAVVENIPLRGLANRSLFLVRGRLLRVIPLLALAVFAAILPPAVKLMHPTVALFALLIQPALIAFAAVGIGALYANLYQR
jgi:hypothetical protein